MFLGKRLDDLSEFVNWGLREDAESITNNIIGPMRSAHLFRSRSAPLHHEFALFCFGKPGAAESWVRVERAARRKAAGLLPQTDSFGPLLGGVELRESISFGCQKSDLCDNADELASVFALPESTTTSEIDAAGHLNLSEIAFQLNETSRADPLYQLFAANCRWFARRTVLSIAQRLDALELVDSLMWKGRAIDSEKLSDKLRHDWFGGRQLAGTRGQEIRASNLLSLAHTSLMSNRFLDALEKARQALAILECIECPTNTQLDLLYHVCWYIGCAYMGRERAIDGFPYFKRAQRVAKAMGLGERVLSLEGMYASCLAKIGRLEEALELRENVIRDFRQQLERASSDHDLPYTREKLSNVLTDHANDLLRVRRTGEALDTIQDAVAIHRELVNYRPDLHRRAFGQSLSLLSAVFIALRRYKEACATALEALEMTREAFAQHPEISRQNLALRLYDYGTACGREGLQEESLQAFTESTMHWEHLHQKEPDFYLPDYAFSLTMWGSSLYLTGRRLEAAKKLNDGMLFETMLYERDQSLYHARFSLIAYTVSMALFSLGDQKALDLGLKDLAISRRLATQSHEEEVTLVDRLVKYARCVLIPHSQKVPWTEEALRFGYDAIQEAIACFGDAADATIARTESLGTALLVLSEHHRISERILDAVVTAVQGFEFLVSSFVPGEPRLVEEVKRAVAQCSNTLGGLFQQDQPDGLTWARRYLIRLREMSTAYPEIFEEELAARLWKHAVWAVEMLKEREDITFFDEAIATARRVCDRFPPTAHESSNSALAQALYSYAGFLEREQSDESPPLMIELLEEAVVIAKQLIARDPKAHAQLSSVIFAAYAEALRKTGRAIEAVEASALVITSVRARVLASVTDSNELAVLLASSLSTHSGYLCEANRLDEAYETCCEAILLSRELFSINSETHRETLAVTLNNLFAILCRLGHLAQSTEAAIETLHHFRILRRSHTFQHAAVFDALLGNLCHIADNTPGTLLSSKISVALSYAFYELNPEQASQNLLDKHLQYAVKLQEEGFLEEAIEVGKRAAEYCRTMFENDPASIRHHLAKVLDNLATDLLNSGNVSACLPLMEECTVHLRILFGSDSAHYGGPLAHILYAHAGALRKLDRDEEALLLLSGAVKLAREQCSSHPTTNIQRILAAALIDHATCCIEQQASVQIRKFLEEAVTLWRSVAKDSPDDLHHLATAVKTLALQLWSTNDCQQAFDLALEGVTLNRQLFKNEPDSHRASLADCLLQYAAMAEVRSQSDIVLAVAEEAVGLTRELYENDPEAHLELLVHRLLSHAEYCRRAELNEKTVQHLSVALPLLRTLVDGQHFQPVILAEALHSYFVSSWNINHHSDALSALAEHIVVMEKLAEVEPEKYERYVESKRQLFESLMRVSADS